MAFLGGLMRGVPGAFIRGSLDTATNIIQASEERGEENIVEKIKDFGARKAAYDKGVNEYTSETRKLQDIAGILQGDAELKDRSMDELMGVAQQLLTIDSSNPLKYFQENRDDFNFTKIDTSTTSVEDQTDAVMETATAPASGTADTGDVGQFVGRLLSGPSEKEQVAEAARRLGITPDMYLRIMAGKVPTRATPTLRVSLAAPDPLDGLITETNKAVTSFLQKDSFRNMQSIPFPTGNETPDGQPEYVSISASQFARTYLDAHSTYVRTGEDGAELHALQHYALSLSMPKDVSNAFGMFSESIKRIDRALENDKTPDAVHDPLAETMNDINALIIRAATEPGFGSGGTELQQMQELVIKGQSLLRQIPSAAGTQTLSPQGQLIKEAVTAIQKRVTETKAGARVVKDGFANQIFELTAEFQGAIGDQTKLKELGAKIAKLNVEAFGDARESPPTADEIELERVMNLLKPYYSHLNENALKEVAGQAIVANPSGLFDSDEMGVFFMQPAMPGTDDLPTKRYIDTQISGGMTTAAPAKVRAADEEKINSNNTDFSRMARLFKVTSDNPLVFTAFGAVTVRGQTYADMFSAFTNSQEVARSYAEYFNVVDQAEARRQAIALVGSAKDRLFDDPRLSDQDLRLVLKFIAILGEDGAGIGVGQTEALAALQGLQIALLKDNASRMYRSKGYANSPSRIFPTNAAGRGNELTAASFFKDGKFVEDGSMASILYQQVALAYGLERKTVDEIKAMSADKQSIYGAKMDFVVQMTNAALEDVKTHYIYNQAMRPQGSSLVDMGDVNDQGVMNIGGANYTVQSLEAALAEAKQRRGGV